MVRVMVTCLVCMVHARGMSGMHGSCYGDVSGMHGSCKGHVWYDLCDGGVSGMHGF